MIKKAVLGRMPELEISSERLESLGKARLGLAEVLAMEEKYDLILANYVEFELSMVECTLDWVLFNASESSEWAGRLTVLNRRLLNLLSSGRLLLDQLRHHASSLFGKTSPERHAIDSAIQIEKQENFGFCATEALRNYTQHRGLPVALLTHHYWRNEMKLPDQKENLSTISPQLSIAKISEDPKFSKTVVEGLREIHQEKVDLKPLVRDWVDGLRSIQESGREMVGTSCDEWDAAIEAAVAEYQVQHGDDVLGLAAMRLNDRGVLQGDRISLSLGAIQRRRSLQKKNAGLGSLARVSVTTGSKV